MWVVCVDEVELLPLSLLVNSITVEFVLVDTVFCSINENWVTSET